MTLWKVERKMNEVMANAPVMNRALLVGYYHKGRWKGHPWCSYMCGEGLTAEGALQATVESVYVNQMDRQVTVVGVVMNHTFHSFGGLIKSDDPRTWPDSFRPRIRGWLRRLRDFIFGEPVHCHRSGNANAFRYDLPSRKSP